MMDACLEPTTKPSVIGKIPQGIMIPNQDLKLVLVRRAASP